MALYLHYWFANYAEKNAVSLNEDSLYANFNAAKVKDKYLGTNGVLRKDFAQRKASMVSGSDSFKEVEEMLDFFSDPASRLAEIRGENYSQNTIGSWRPMQTVRSFVDPNEVASNISTFMMDLQSKLDEMSKKLNFSLDDFKNAVIQEYAENKGISPGSKKFSRMVIQDFITHGGIKRLKLSSTTGSGNATIDSCARSMILLASALPSYGSEGSMSLGAMRYSTGSTAKGSFRVTKSGSETLAIIAGKLTGLWSNVVGSGGEMAWAKAEEVGLKKIQDELTKTNSSLNKTFSGKNLSYSVRVTGSDIVQDKKNNLQSVSKPDVSVSITDGSVVINYGVSVKQYGFNSKAKSETVAMVKSTSFLAAVERYSSSGKDKGYLLNLAAGHPGRGGSSQKASEYTTGALNNAWKNLVDSVVIANFLDFVAGAVTESPGVLYVVANGQIIKVEDILDDAFNNPEHIYSRVHGIGANGKGDRGLTRASMMKMNTWKWANASNKTMVSDRNTQIGIARSETVIPQLYERLAAQKLDVSLKMLLPN